MSPQPQFSTRMTILSVLPYCPDDEWRLLFVFARYVGPRIPSEIERLTWNDVDWLGNRILLKSPKTESHGRAERYVPIFPELKPWLERQFHNAEDGEGYVFPRLRHHTNLGTTAGKLVKRVHGRVWPSFWNSLRATRETELMDAFGLRRACAWIGNSPKVAMENYALMRKSDYLDVGGATDFKCDAKSAAIGANQGESARIGSIEKPAKTGLIGSTRNRR